MKVLIVKVSALGDVVHSLPVLAYLHSAHPGVEIDWLVEEGFSSILEGQPLVKRVIPLQTKDWRKLPFHRMVGQVIGFARRLRRNHYDLVFDLQGNSKSGLFTLLSRGRAKYGFDRQQVREWPNLLATNHRVTLSTADHHVAQRALAVVKAAVPQGPDVPLAGPLTVQADARQRVEQQLVDRHLADKKLVVLHYGTTWQTKLWSLNSWRQLAQRLVAEADVVPLLTWGNEQERDAAQAISQATEGQALVWPRGSLAELVALLDRVALVVGCDTGPIHIAAALSTPTVSLFRVTDAMRNGPQGQQHRCLQAPLSCAPCLRKHCDRDAECAQSISVDAVCRAIHELMA